MQNIFSLCSLDVFSSFHSETGGTDFKINMTSSDMEPGISNLPLDINKAPLDQEEGQYRIKILKDYLNRKENRHERFAVRNLVGVLSSLIGEHV